MTTQSEPREDGYRSVVSHNESQCPPVKKKMIKVNSQLSDKVLVLGAFPAEAIVSAPAPIDFILR